MLPPVRSHDDARRLRAPVAVNRVASGWRSSGCVDMATGAYHHASRGRNPDPRRRARRRSSLGRTMIPRAAFAALLLSALAAPRASGVVASPPQILGPLVGPGSVKPQPDLAFFGTDLGWTVVHRGALRILFGDTDDVFNAVCFPQLHNDDSQGTMPLERPPTGVPPVTMLTA